MLEWDNKNTIENSLVNWIDLKINSLVNEIEKDFRFKWNTLNELFDFKLVKWKEDVNFDSVNLLSDLHYEIERKNKIWDIKSSNELSLTKEETKVLADKIFEIRKLTNDIHNWINELKKELQIENEIFSAKDMLTSKLYSKNTLNRIENPQNFKDHIDGLLIWLVEFWSLWVKLSYDIIKWLILSIYHISLLLRWKERYETNIKI